MRMAGVVSRTHCQGLLSTGIDKLLKDFCNGRKSLGVSHGDHTFHARRFRSRSRFQIQGEGLRGRGGGLTGVCISSDVQSWILMESSQAGMPDTPCLLASGSCL